MGEWFWNAVQWLVWVAIFIAIPAAIGFGFSYFFGAWAGIGAGLFAAGCLWALMTFVLNFTPLQPGAVPFMLSGFVALVGLMLFIRFV